MGQDGVFPPAGRPTKLFKCRSVEQGSGPWAAWAVNRDLRTVGRRPGRGVDRAKGGHTHKTHTHTHADTHPDNPDTTATGPQATGLCRVMLPSRWMTVGHRHEPAGTRCGRICRRRVLIA